MLTVLTYACASPSYTYRKDNKEKAIAAALSVKTVASCVYLWMIRDTDQIAESLKAIGDKEKARWLEHYVKHDIRSLGVGIPDIREIVRKHESANQFTRRPIHVQIHMLDGLMECVYTEAKLAAILYMQLYWKADTVDEMLQLVARWFDNEWIADWNVCDWLCVRLLSPLVDSKPEQTVAALEQWNGSANLWKARASLVPFAQCKTMVKHTGTILKLSEVLIRRDERFCKTAVGWVLRQYSKIDMEFVRDFLKRNVDHTTAEVVKNATKYLKRGDHNTLNDTPIPRPQKNVSRA